MFKNLFNKKSVTIIVTDSGLGGVSIAADLVERIDNSGIFQKVSVVFFNSSFDNKSGYNILEKNADKVRIFNNALNSMQQSHKPDLIMIGCNTLSVIYPETPFFKETTTPVIGILETGVDFILEKIDSAADANIVIFATPTTISKGSHKKALVEKGVKPEKIIGISCSDLADKIEEGPRSQATQSMVSQFVVEAINKIKNANQPLIVSLNCTHYGYVLPLFRQEFEKNGIKPDAVLNPNLRISNFLFKPANLHRYNQTDTSIEIISKVTIFPEIIKTISKLVEMTSRQTVKALQNYKQDTKLF